MRIVFSIVILMLFTGCKKDDVESFYADPLDYYQAQGNLLILILDSQGSFNYAHEFQIDSLVLANDSIQMDIWNPWTPPGTSFSGILQPFNDTLYSHGESYYGVFREDKIQSTQFYRNNIYMPYELGDTQILDSIPGGVSYQQLWSNISNLDIVKKYRSDSPNSKVGYMYKDTPDNLTYNSAPKRKNCIVLTR